VAKNLFLWSGRSWFRKGLEAWFTALIELFWSKERILEVYLNSAEWGKGVFGAQAAARYHFGVDASRLSASRRRSWQRCCRARSSGVPAGPVPTWPAGPAGFVGR